MFIEAPESIQHVERIAREVSTPKMINMISHSVTPTLSLSQLEHYGFRLAIYPILTMTSAMNAMLNALRALHEDGDDRSVAQLQSPRELFELFDLDGWQTIAGREVSP